uniref:hypothetical protein n=1 Tax=Alicyclobacillus sendaiensis TaxID=192387 RepID=UPI003F891D85
MYRYEHSSTPIDTEQLRKWLYDNLRVAGRPNRDGWVSGHCPLHDDTRASLGINIRTGKWKCHAGCGSGDLRELARRAGLPAPPLSRRKRYGGKPTDVYEYQNEHGIPVFRVLRWGHGKGKKFKQEHWDGRRWRSGRNNTPDLPYRLPELIEAIRSGKTILVVEGEKDVERLMSIAFPATCNPGGACHWPTDDSFNRFFAGADVVIVPDNDEPGRKHAEQVAMALRPYARRIRWLELEGLPHKGDVTDWLASGHGVRDLLQAIEGAPEWQPDPRLEHAMAIVSYFRDGKFNVKA